MGAVGIIAAIFIGGNYLRQPAPIQVSNGISPIGQPGVTGNIVVEVAGAVKKPGIYELKSKARVTDAISAAGGFARDADKEQINLAEPLSDGVKVTIPRLGDDSASGIMLPAAQGFVGSSKLSTSSPAKSSATGLISLNRASQSDLESLPGIGPIIAKKILEYRQSIGGFKSIDQLLEVNGIGPKKLEKMRAHVQL